MKSQERIDAENYSHLKEFYLLLEGIYKKYSFSPARIFNVDESPFFWNLGIKKVGAFFNYNYIILIF